MEIKEMPLEEKYNGLNEDYGLFAATTFALLKEQGMLDKFMDLWAQVQKKNLPSFLGMTAFNILKTISPGRAFKQLVDQFTYSLQRSNSLANIELTKVTDREAVIRINNCEGLKGMREIVEKVGLDVDPKEFCTIETAILPQVIKEFGVDLSIEREENGCIFKGKLI